jgi:hypothetical protein
MAFEDTAAIDRTRRRDYSGDAAHSAEASVKRQYTIKGIEDQTVELMRSAARKEGMRVGAWVSARLKEAADRALQDPEPNSEFVELREHIRRIEENQRQEQGRLGIIQDELAKIVRAQHSIMARILDNP